MSDLIGKTLGPYRILEQIGAGGMATVYKAYQPGMDRYVAVKILPHYLSTQDEQFLKRFQREARAIAKLEHAHILPVYDYGEHEDIPYLTMRYVQAGTLKERIAKSPLSLDEINHIIGQVGSALDYAHRLGVIHRDVKPGNVLIDNQGDTFLTDFGLARMMEASQHLTASGVGVGTPAYMSPEQSQGYKVDHRSDIYSLGVILYEMVTGRVPYEAETPMGVVLKHITAPLPLPRAVAPNVPESVELVILKALAKDPAARYQTAGEMVQALSAAVRKVENAETQQPAVTSLSEPTREDVSLITRVQKLWAQPRGKAGLIGSGLIAVVVLGLVLNWLLPTPISIVGLGATATSTGGNGTPVGLVASATLVPTNPAEPTRAPRPTQTARPTATTGPTATPNPLALGETLEMCGGDICICKNGNCTPTGLSQTYVDFSPNHLSWSPDGTSFVFTACLLESVLNNPSAACTSRTYIAQRGGSGVFEIPLRLEVDHYMNPAWSPDGNWIAAMTSCGLSMIRPDGTDYRMVVPYNGLDCPWAIAWSPDSQRLAWIGGIGGAATTSTYVWIANSDGSDAKIVLYSPEVELIAPIAWNPSGDSVAVTLQDGKRYLIDAGCQGGATGCDESSRTEILDIPKDWLHNFHPQWISAKSAPTPTLSPQAAQARAFAEPILQAIVNRPPDYEYDFNEPENGWISGREESNARGYVDGEYFVTVKPSGGTGAGPGKDFVFSDFVAELDARILKATDPGGWGFIFREQPSPQSFRYHINFNNSGLSLFLDTGSYTDLFYLQGAPVQPAPEINHLLVIAKGPNTAIYVNGEPVTVVSDSTLSSGIVSLGIHAGEQETEVRFDNFKLWDISDLP